MIINGIDYLFHYTSLERLAQILKNRTIRLSPLENMDDLQERKARDIDNFGRFFFTSCWTEEKTESIPMWNMYTNIRAGVRIALPKNPFKRHRTTVEGLTSVLKTPPMSNSTNEANTFLDLADLYRNNYFSPQAWSGDILFQINYTDDIELLEPHIVFRSDNKINLQTSTFGRYKNTYWKFQKEWRYLMLFIPMHFGTDVNLMNYEFNLTVNRMALGQQAAPFDHFDLDIDPEMFKKMIITKSPKLSEGNQILLNSIIKEYNPNAHIEESDLYGLI